MIYAAGSGGELEIVNSSLRTIVFHSFCEGFPMRLVVFVQGCGFEYFTRKQDFEKKISKDLPKSDRHSIAISSKIWVNLFGFCFSEIFLPREIFKAAPCMNY